MPNPTVGASSNKPLNFFPLISKNKPTNHIYSFRKNLFDPSQIAEIALIPLLIPVSIDLFEQF